MCQTENKSGRVGKEIGTGDWSSDVCSSDLPQNFNAKLKRESFTVAELEDIAEAAGVTFERSFVLDDGDTV